jgi:predicted RNA-binding protein YlqC (UPF0109 family)
MADAVANAERPVLEVRELVEEIVRAIVDYPDQVDCREVRGTHSCVLELTVAPEDVGKVIGRKGVHADAIRRLVHAAGGKRRMRYVLEIIEER